jgi:hypothetical protein
MLHNPNTTGNIAK